MQQHLHLGTCSHAAPQALRTGRSLREGPGAPRCARMMAGPASGTVSVRAVTAKFITLISPCASASSPDVAPALLEPVASEIKAQVWAQKIETRWHLYLQTRPASAYYAHQEMSERLGKGLWKTEAEEQTARVAHCFGLFAGLPNLQCLHSRREGCLAQVALPWCLTPAAPPRPRVPSRDARHSSSSCRRRQCHSPVARCELTHA